MLAKRIARESTVSPADTHAVLRALPNVMADFMKESRAIHFEGLGWFRYSINAMGKGVENREDVSDKQIKGLRVQFTPRPHAEYGKRGLHAGSHRQRRTDVHGVAGEGERRDASA